MTTLQITPTWRITDDGTNRILQRLVAPTKGKNAGRARWVDVGYYTTLQAAVIDALDEMTLAEDHTTARSIVSALDRNVKAIRDAIRAQGAPRCQHKIVRLSPQVGQ